MNQTPFYTLDELVALKNENKLTQPTQISFSTQPQNSMRFRDVHCYDGKLTSPPDIHIRHFEMTEKQELFKKLNFILCGNNPPCGDNPPCGNSAGNRASWMVSRMLSEHDMFDPSNKMTPSDILATILTRRMTIDILGLLEEQLSDIALLGQCPQGRSTRLIQILDMTV